MAERTIKIKVTMEERWIPEFVGMRKLMEHNGNIGHSGRISFYADGEGDFHPKFDIKYTSPDVDKSVETAKSRSLNHWVDLLEDIKSSSNTSMETMSRLAYSDAEFDAG